jgi:competence protein ComEC
MLGLALMPLGLERSALIVMGWGIEGVLWIARHRRPSGAVWRAPHIPPWGPVVVTRHDLACAVAEPTALAGVAMLLLGLASPMLVRRPTC